MLADTIGLIASSNLVQTVSTFLFGCIFYFLLRRFPLLLNIFTYFIAGGIFFSFLFNVGEVYSYTYLYKRAFFTFGDDITTILVFIFCYSLFLNKKSLSLLSISAVFLSGGKISYMILLLMSLLHALFDKSLSFKVIAKKYFVFAVLGISIYFSMIGYSRFFEHTGITEQVQLAYSSIQTLQEQLVSRANTISVEDAEFESSENTSIQFQVRGAGACDGLSFHQCFTSQLHAAFAQRYYSSIVGLWMTLKGGFRGASYPATGDEFAALVIQENPWGINDRYNLTWSDWRRMGQIQNPYLRFGSGYGVLGLTVLCLVFGLICLLCVLQLRGRGKNSATIFSIFFIVNTIFNQSQSWISPRSLVLILTGLCAAGVTVVSLEKNFKFPHKVPGYHPNYRK